MVVTLALKLLLLPRGLAPLVENRKAPRIFTFRLKGSSLYQQLMTENACYGALRK